MDLPIFTSVNKNNYNVIGVMSGTSLDGIDLACVSFEKSSNWNFHLGPAETVAYPPGWVEDLQMADTLEEEYLEDLNDEYTRYLARVVREFILKHNLQEVEAVCSHGHTIKHEPEKGRTLQIGNLPGLADLLGITVVCDFRVQDVALGGQGAPLVPIGDQLLFANYDYCLNLGGFANISTMELGRRIAYDICPVNTVLNFLANKLGHPYDRNGAMARSGRIDEGLLQSLNGLQFYQENPPKSLGIEWVRREIFPLLKSSSDILSALATFSLHIAMQISRTMTGARKKALVTGGGAFNKFLLEQLQANTYTELKVPSPELVNFKEAVIFAFLGVLRLRGETNVLSSVTGAAKDHSSGVVFRPRTGKVQAL